MIYEFDHKVPQIADTAFIAPGARIIGDVTIEEGASIWFNAVLRGDEAPIKVGKFSNIQDNSTCHLYDAYPLILEDEVSVGHNVILHGCTIKKGSLIGMGSIIMDGVEIGEQCLIGANTFISSNKKIPPRSLVVGNPGKVIRSLTDKDLALIQLTIDTYKQKAIDYLKSCKKVK
ncbi:MAG TPA: gamma carbonic anhydrase family protein [Massilibacterium sp.]|nr:gamma carbonic anhydrase family protein [Massilibacterium sp.]